MDTQLLVEAVSTSRKYPNDVMLNVMDNSPTLIVGASMGSFRSFEETMVRDSSSSHCTRKY